MKNDTDFEGQVALVSFEAPEKRYYDTRLQFQQLTFFEPPVFVDECIKTAGEWHT